MHGLFFRISQKFIDFDFVFSFSLFPHGMDRDGSDVKELHRDNFQADGYRHSGAASTPTDLTNMVEGSDTRQI